MQEALQRFVAAMASYRETHTLSEEEGALLQNACVSMTNTLCPFIAERLSKIFPSPANLVDMAAITAALSEDEVHQSQETLSLTAADKGTKL